MLSNVALYLYSFLTLAAFCTALWLNKRLKSLIFNTFVLTLLLLIAILLLANIPYADYMRGNAPLNDVLGLSIVALALPLYQQLRQISHRWRSILLITTLASLLSMFSGAGVALLFGADAQIAANILPKSTSMPIAIAIAETVGGIPSVAAVGVVLAGLQGSIFGYLILKKIGLKHPEAIGLSIGAVSHALGTARALEINQKIGVYSSIALVLCGILSSILAPLVFYIVLLFA